MPGCCIAGSRGRRRIVGHCRSDILLCLWSDLSDYAQIAPLVEEQSINAALAYSALPEERPALEDVLAAAKSKSKVRCLCQPGRFRLPAQLAEAASIPTATARL